MDELKWLPEAFKVAFPGTNIQNCIVHQIRNSLKYVASKDTKAFMKDLKLVFKASAEVEALTRLDSNLGFSASAENPKFKF